MTNRSFLKQALNLLYPVELAGINETDEPYCTTKKEEEIEDTNKEHNVDNEIPKQSRSKRIASKRSNKELITVL